MQDGEEEEKHPMSDNKGNAAIGLLLWLFAYYVYQSNILLAGGVFLLGAYLIFGGKK